MNRCLLLALLVAVSPSVVHAQDVQPAKVELHGMHDGRQLLVIGAQQRDLTRDAKYHVEPAGELILNLVDNRAQAVAPAAQRVVEVEKFGQIGSGFGKHTRLFFCQK